MLSKNPIQRITVSDILAHDWITEAIPEKNFIIRSSNKPNSELKIVQPATT